MTEKPNKEDIFVIIIVASGGILLGIMIALQGFGWYLSHHFSSYANVSAAVSDASFHVIQEVMLSIQDECTALLGVICPLSKPECKGKYLIPLTLS